MANFPFNTDREHDEDDDNFNGCPFSYSDMVGLADQILFWHTEKSTGKFSHSGDGFDDGVKFLVFGLAELLSDPNSIHRLMTMGEAVKKEVEMLKNSRNVGNWDIAKKAVNKTFNK